MQDNAEPETPSPFTPTHRNALAAAAVALSVFLLAVASTYYGVSLRTQLVPLPSPSPSPSPSPAGSTGPTIISFSLSAPEIGIRKRLAFTVPTCSETTPCDVVYPAPLGEPPFEATETDNLSWATPPAATVNAMPPPYTTIEATLEIAAPAGSSWSISALNDPLLITDCTGSADVTVLQPGTPPRRADGAVSASGTHTITCTIMTEVVDGSGSYTVTAETRSPEPVVTGSRPRGRVAGADSAARPLTGKKLTQQLPVSLLPKKGVYKLTEKPEYVDQKKHATPREALSPGNISAGAKCALPGGRFALACTWLEEAPVERRYARYLAFAFGTYNTDDSLACDPTATEVEFVDDITKKVVTTLTLPPFSLREARWEADNPIVLPRLQSFPLLPNQDGTVRSRQAEIKEHEQGHVHFMRKLVEESAPRAYETKIPDRLYAVLKNTYGFNGERFTIPKGEAPPRRFASIANDVCSDFLRTLAGTVEREVMGKYDDAYDTVTATGWTLKTTQPATVLGAARWASLLLDTQKWNLLFWMSEDPPASANPPGVELRQDGSWRLFRSPDWLEWLGARAAVDSHWDRNELKPGEARQRDNYRFPYFRIK